MAIWTQEILSGTVLSQRMPFLPPSGDVTLNPAKPDSQVLLCSANRRRETKLYT